MAPLGFDDIIDRKFPKNYETDMGMDRYSRHRCCHSEFNYRTELPDCQYTCYRPSDW